MFFQEATPDTSGYMIAGYVIAFVVMALYVASIYLRARNLDQDVTMLEEMEKPVPPIQTPVAPQAKKGPAKSAGKRPAKAATRKTRKNY